MRVHLRPLAALAAITLGPVGCADDDEGKDRDSPSGEASERAARPPPGWRTVTNRVVGFTIAAPKAWPAATNRRSTLIRSDDRLVSITVAADRSPGGQALSPGRYARRTIESLPGFEGRIHRRARRVRGSPYRSAVVDASGTVEATTRPQRISVATFRPGNHATYSAIVFRNARIEPRLNDRKIARILRTFRARSPAEQRGWTIEWLTYGHEIVQAAKPPRTPRRRPPCLRRCRSAMPSSARSVPRPRTPTRAHPGRSG